jgi:hypothetical protein
MGLENATDLALDGDTLWLVTAGPDGRHVLAFDATSLERRQHFLVPVLAGGETWAFDVAAVDGRVLITEHNLGGGLTVIDATSSAIVRQDDFGEANASFRTSGATVEGDVVWICGGGQAIGIRAGTAEVVRSVSLTLDVQQITPLGDGRYLAPDWMSGGVFLLQFPD